MCDAVNMMNVYTDSLILSREFELMCIIEINLQRTVESFVGKEKLFQTFLSKAESCQFQQR